MLLDRLTRETWRESFMQHWPHSGKRTAATLNLWTSGLVMTGQAAN